MLQAVLLSMVLTMIALSTGAPLVKAVLLLLALIVMMGATLSRHE